MTDTPATFDVAVIAKTRHGALLRYRLEQGLTQKAAAEAAGVTPAVWNQVECLRFQACVVREHLERIGDLVGMEADDLIPAELRGRVISETRVAFKSVDLRRLAAGYAGDRHVLPPPDEVAADAEAIAVLGEDLAAGLAGLTARARAIVERRFGIGCDALTLSECSDIFKISRERARQIENNAIGKLRAAMDARAVKRDAALAGLVVDEETRPCPRCDGCGKHARDFDMTPWIESRWDEIPIYLIPEGPLDCALRCGGTGFTGGQTDQIGTGANNGD